MIATVGRGQQPTAIGKIRADCWPLSDIERERERRVPRTRVDPHSASLPTISLWAARNLIIDTLLHGTDQPPTT